MGFWDHGDRDVVWVTALLKYKQCVVPWDLENVYALPAELLSV